ncbi:MAG: sugar phosphate isomerase/epimerase [Clostridia bacterium]|nr:sugar phosphate isomerase/epimerase [Clostridia bacterium]
MANYILSAFADEYSDSFEEQLTALKGFGIDYIELRFVDGVNVADLSDEQVSRVKTLLLQYGTKVSAIGSPLGKTPLDEPFGLTLERAERIFSIASTLGTRRVRFFSFYPAKNTPFDEDEVIRRIEVLADLAEEKDIILCHENEAVIFGESPDACAKMLGRLGGRVKAVFDMGNFTVEGYNPLEAFDLLSEHIEYFHIKDALSAGAIVPPGKGEARIAEILKAYKRQMKTDTFITVEPHLQTFSGLNALVGRAFDNPYKFPDKRAAFTAAVEALCEILNDVEENL